LIIPSYSNKVNRRLGPNYNARKIAKRFIIATMKRFLQLLTPSPTGVIVTLVGTMLIAGFNVWSYIEYRQFFYDFLSSETSLKTALLESPDHLALFRRTVLGNGGFTYYFVVVLAGVLASLVTYALLSSLERARDDAEDIAHEMRRPEHEFHASAHQELLRIAVRGASLVGWALYAVLWVKLLIPYCFLLIDNGIDEVVAMENVGYLYIAVSCVIIALSMHLHTVFLRLFLLRVRTFRYE
jgi:hypothetical protein